MSPSNTTFLALIFIIRLRLNICILSMSRHNFYTIRKIFSRYCTGDTSSVNFNYEYTVVRTLSHTCVHLIIEKRALYWKTAIENSFLQSSRSPPSPLTNYEILSGSRPLPTNLFPRRKIDARFLELAGGIIIATLLHNLIPYSIEQNGESMHAREENAGKSRLARVHRFRVSCSSADLFPAPRKKAVTRFIAPRN